MPHFPTQYSTLSAEALNEHIRSAYDLDNITTQFLVRNVSDTYVIKQGAPRYILKIYRDKHRSKAQIKGEVDLLNMLKDNHAHVAYPIADKTGEYLQSFETGEGTRYGVLFTYAEGKVYDNLSETQLKLLGHQMAYNHDLTSQKGLVLDRPEYNLTTLIHQPMEVLLPMFEMFSFTAGFDHLQQVAKRTVNAFESMDTSAFSVGYCHYDYLPKNFHITDEGNLTLFDFDFAGKGFLVNDLMSFQVHFFFKVLFGAMSEEQAASEFQIFVTAYREKRAISDAELEAIPTLGVMYWIFYLAVQYQGFDDFSNPYFNRDFIKRWLDRIDQWEALYGNH